MRIAIVGSRTINDIDLSKYLPEGEFCLVSGGARGVDSVAKRYATDNGIGFLEITPDYKKYGRAAPIIRNREIVDLSDRVIVFWDGSSRGAGSVIDYCKRVEKLCTVVITNSEGGGKSDG